MKLLEKLDLVDKKNNQKPTKIILIISLFLAICCIFLAFMTTISWLLIILWLLWLIFVWLEYSGKLAVKMFGLSFCSILIIWCVVSFLIFIFTKNQSSNSTSSSSKSLTSAQCKPYYDKYNGKVYQIKSDGLQGNIGIKINTNKGCTLMGYYHVLLSYNVPNNPYKNNMYQYNYLVTLRNSKQTTRTKYDEHGSLSPASSNFNSLPDPFASTEEASKLYHPDTQIVADTRYFYWSYNIYTDFSEKRFQEIFDDTKFEIVDGLPYITETPTSGGGYSYGIDYEKAGKEGKIIKSYNLSIK